MSTQSEQAPISPGSDPVSSTDIVEAGPVVDARGRSASVQQFAAKYGTLAFLGALIVGFSIAEPKYFFSLDNLQDILVQSSLGIIIAVGLTFTLVVGEFDLSIGATASLAGVVVIGMVLDGRPALLAIVLSVLIGVIIGVFNGFLVTKVGVNSLIATLGTASLVAGINFAYTDGIPRSLGTEYRSFSQLALGKFLGISHQIWFMAIVIVLAWTLLNRTPVGQEIQAVGGNEQASRLAGLRVHRRKIISFAIAGSLAAFTGVLLAARVSSGQIAAGQGFLLPAFAAAFLGSAVLRNGEFHIIGTVIGGITIAVGANGLAIVGVPAYVQDLFTGGVLIGAVALSSVARRTARE